MRRAFLFLAVVGAATPAAAGEFRGPAKARDGDTLEIGAFAVRLFGVDAPENGQSCGDGAGGVWDCGAAARARLEALIAAGETACAAVERDRHGRVVARCAAGGVDLGATLVAEGLAWAYVEYSFAYADLEAGARASGLGVWQGPATVAWDWRRAEGFAPAAGVAEPEPAAEAAAAAGTGPAETGPGGCAIKGNVNAEGERIYHTPESPWYARINMDARPGQRWFCDAAEAEAAGWRAAGGASGPTPDAGKP